MRISPISYAQPKIFNYNLRTKKVHENTNSLQPQMEPSFKGGKAGFWGIAGTIIGGGVAAVLTGGTALLPVLLGSATGAYGGCMYGSANEDKDKGDD